MIEKKKTVVFSRLFLKSEFAWFFQDIYYFANKFVNTFGVVMEAQFFIAVVNTVITTLKRAETLKNSLGISFTEHDVVNGLPDDDLIQAGSIGTSGSFGKRCESVCHEEELGTVLRRGRL